MYNMFGVPHAIILNSEGKQYDSRYVHDQESYGARWLRNNGELENTMIHADETSAGKLISQAGIRQYDCYSLFVGDKKVEGYIYLKYYNVVDGKLVDEKKEEHNIAEYGDKFVGKGKVYDNGDSEVWR